MRGWSITAALLAGGVVQAVFPLWPVLGQAPAPVLLGVVVYYALYRNTAEVMAVAVLAGLVQDALGLIPLGYSSLGFAVAGLVMNRFREEVFAWQWLTTAVFGGLAAGFVTLALYGILRVTGDLGIPVQRMPLKLVGAVALGVVWTPLAVHLLERMDAMLGIAEARQP